MGETAAGGDQRADSRWCVRGGFLRRSRQLQGVEGVASVCGLVDMTLPPAPRTTLNRDFHCLGAGCNRGRRPGRVALALGLLVSTTRRGVGCSAGTFVKKSWPFLAGSC